MRLLSKLTNSNAKFSAADDLSNASLTKTPTPGNPQGNGSDSFPKPEEKEKIASSFLNINQKSTNEIRRFRKVKRKDKFEKKVIEKQNSISRRKQMKAPILASSLKKNLNREKEIKSDTEMSPLI